MRVERTPMKTTPALLCACALACGHAPAKPPPPATPSSSGARARPVLPPPPDDPRDFAAELSEETRTLLRAEGDLLWTRWTTGSGPLPSGALADHPRLFQREGVSAVASAAASARKPADELALRLRRPRRKRRCHWPRSRWLATRRLPRRWRGSDCPAGATLSWRFTVRRP